MGSSVIQDQFDIFLHGKVFGIFFLMLWKHTIFHFSSTYATHLVNNLEKGYVTKAQNRTHMHAHVDACILLLTIKCAKGKNTHMHLSMYVFVMF